GPSPFPIVTGASAGAINGAAIAARSAGFGEGTRELARLWSELSVEQVFRTDAPSLALGALRFARDMALGPLLGTTLTQALLDASPLRALLARVLPLDGIADSIRAGHLYAVAVLATSYHSGRSFTFVQGRPGHPVWVKSRRVVLPVCLTVDHVAASAAIPVVFPPVPISSAVGDVYFGDGALRLVTPFSPAIRLGATHVFAIGIRSPRAADALWQQELGVADGSAVHAPGILPPPLAQICGVFLNAIFLDHLDSDLDHLKRMNELVATHGAHVAPARGDGTPAAEPMRVVEPLVVCPSEDLALVAQRFAHRMPRLVRLVLEGLGTPDAQSADMTSYLLFDSFYTRTLVQIGYRDASERIDEIEAFLRGARESARRDGAEEEAPDVARVAEEERAVG
ncbi:MAG: patatin-like phospholipase family protein, partial [Thermodesulfobacteriota bacterium]